ncbi:serine protease inhibitor I/II-like [Euwallacea similis]|uniref:serine protease inhibitor I/II-like n=1 Tax=Euwallacea similis TaxID=1736056 RepID=UPI00344BCCE0
MARLGIFVCLLFVLVVFAQLANAEECTPGATKKEDCNSCSCISPGIWICTKIQCRNKREAQTEPCTEGQTTSFDNGCNTCTCTNGIWACTQKLCLAGIIPSSRASKGEKQLS